MSIKILVKGPIKVIFMTFFIVFFYFIYLKKISLAIIFKEITFLFLKDLHTKINKEEKSRHTADTTSIYPAGKRGRNQQQEQQQQQPPFSRRMGPARSAAVTSHAANTPSVRFGPILLHRPGAHLTLLPDSRDPSIHSNIYIHTHVYM